jgi:hypothetical protein
MLPGVSTRALVVNEPMPPTIGPYTDPPFASAPWHATHFASYTFLPSATLRAPAASPRPRGAHVDVPLREVRLGDGLAEVADDRRPAALRAAALAQRIPLRDLAAIPRPAACPPELAHPHARSPAASAHATAVSRLADDIAHLPFSLIAHGWIAVVVLDEADDGARLLESCTVGWT